MADTENYVSLVREMRASFGTSYGISLTLAPDYWYLRGFDAISMQPYVDWFGFMAYDLHGFWCVVLKGLRPRQRLTLYYRDEDITALGSVVRGQTDIGDIENDVLPLWFDGLDPQKINFGLAYYGRGYTLADAECNTLLCPFAGPSSPAPCTNYAGVMSLWEIEELIAQGLTPTYLPTAMMKQITWGDQWIGYDDTDTFFVKQAWADAQCFGGTMFWSIDFKSAGRLADFTLSLYLGVISFRFSYCQLA